VDPRILDANRAWGTAFLDLAEPPLSQPPSPTRFFEVSYYSRIGKGDVRKTCVFFYSPSQSDEPGVIYLPGGADDPTIRYLNTGTIIRGARDGAWSFASPAWEAQVKPLITKALPVALPELRPAVTVESWSVARPGWLYVIDAAGDAEARILEIDPIAGRVMGSVRPGERPDIALSADGQKLFIASGEREWGELSVIDTATGAIRHVPFPDRILYNPWYAGAPPYSTMDLSPDGTALRILLRYATSPHQVEVRSIAFDTRNESFAPLVRLQSCGGVDGRYRQRMALLRPDGTTGEFDPATDGLVSAPDSNCRRWDYYPLRWPVSPDGAKVFLGFGGRNPSNFVSSNEIRVFDLANGKKLNSSPTSIPFWSAAISADGTLIYAVAPEQRQILVIDAATLQEKGSFTAGNRPAFAISAP
jgi:hypothetical protein